MSPSSLLEQEEEEEKSISELKERISWKNFSILDWFIHFLPRIATILPPVSGLSKCGSFVLTSTYTSTSTNPLIHFPIEFNSIHSSKTVQASPHIPLYSVQIQTFLTNLTFNSIQPLSVVALSCTVFQAKSPVMQRFFTHVSIANSHRHSKNYLTDLQKLISNEETHIC